MQFITLTTWIDIRLNRSDPKSVHEPQMYTMTVGTVGLQQIYMQALRDRRTWSCSDLALEVWNRRIGMQMRAR